MGGRPQVFRGQIYTHTESAGTVVGTGYQTSRVHTGAETFIGQIISLGCLEGFWLSLGSNIMNVAGWSSAHWLDKTSHTKPH